MNNLKIKFLSLVRNFSTASQSKSSVNPKIYIDAWKHILKQSQNPWVLYSHGTCILLPKKTTNLSEQATKFIKQNGPVYPGSQHGDFLVQQCKNMEGWKVMSFRQQMMTFVSPSERFFRGEIDIGLHGRTKRNNDSKSLQIIHIQQENVK